MAESKTRMAPRQTSRLARLLVNFQRETVAVILQRFDRETRLRVQSQIDELRTLGCQSDEQLLTEFADFLYFEPQQVPDRQAAIRKPDLGSSLSAQKTLTFHDILQFNDESLDQLLKAASPQLTIQVLTCSPQEFVKRVLARLSDDDATVVRQRMTDQPTIDFAQMQSIHRQYCDLARQLIEQGVISR